MQQLVGDSSNEAALRYRELEAWRDVAQTMIERHAVTRGTVGGPPARGPDTTSPIPPPDEATAQ